MIDVIARNWGWILLRGIVALLFGLLTFFSPAIALITLVLLYGAFAFADGVFALVSVVANRRGQAHWLAMLIGGLAGILVGIVTFVAPGITATVLLLLIASWAVVTGILEVVAAIRMRREITGEWLLLLAGVLSLIFGLVLFARPAAGALAVVLWIGAYAIIVGIVRIGLAFRLRSWSRRMQGTPSVHPA
jgi:uncharacterized membrane protein HdeD (DUF308 family)